MPLVLSDSVVVDFECPQGWPEWVVRDARTDIQIDYLVDGDCWDELVPTLARLNGVPPDVYAEAARRALELEDVTFTTHWPNHRSAKVGADTSTALWLGNSAFAYQLWLHGIPEDQWSKSIDLSEMEDRVIDEEEFLEFWEGLHARAKALVAHQRPVIRRRGQTKEGQLVRAIESLAPPEGAVFIEDADETKVN